MPGNFKKDDLRVMKTHKMLLTSMTKLLGLRNFNKILVNDLCEEALISRTTFYSHFIDKYDLLKYWLTNVKHKIVSDKKTYEDTEKRVNDFANNNKNVIRNLIEDADTETLELLCNWILSILNIKNYKAEKEQVSLNNIILSNFCCGGMLNYILWQVKNQFPTYLQVMNPYIYNLVRNMQKWNDEQK